MAQSNDVIELLKTATAHYRENRKELEELYCKLAKIGVKIPSSEISENILTEFLGPNDEITLSLSEMQYTYRITVGLLALFALSVAKDNM